MQKITGDKSGRIVLSMALLLLLMILYNTFHAHASGDDYIYAVRGMRLGVAGLVADEYNTWGGRYSSTAIMALLSQIIDFRTDYWIIPFIIIGLTCMSFGYLTSAFRGFQPNRQILTTAALLFILYVMTLPRVDQAFSAMASSVSYQISNCLLLVMIGMVCRYFVRNYNRRQLTTGIAAASVLAFFNAGMNETVMLVQSVFLLAVFALAVQHRRAYACAWMIPLSAGLIGAGIVFLAPGNAVRSYAILNENKNSLEASLACSLGYAIYTMAYLYAILYLISTCILQDYFTRFIQAVGNRLDSIPNRMLLMYLAAFVLLIVSCYFPSFWAKGKRPPGRTLSVVFLLLLLGWIPFLAILHRLRNLKTLVRPKILNSRKAVRMVRILLAVLLIAPFNLAKIVYDSATIHRYDAEQNIRYALLAAAREYNATLVVLPKLAHKPKSIWATDIEEDPGSLENEYYALYFGVQAVKVD